RGKYLLARMHTKLMPEFKVIDARHDEMVKSYGNPQTEEIVAAEDDAANNVKAGDKIIRPVDGQWQVPPDKMDEFTKAWDAICDEDIDVDVQPIPLLALCMPNGTEGLIEAGEFIILGDLVTDTSN
ncbi:MAG: hypothetical protein KGR26_15700, partial [Cyanobacteria bacterium REEB65]|nr:hypothetical protein [Cyanobacteria bacterium REEB65]